MKHPLRLGISGHEVMPFPKELAAASPRQDRRADRLQQWLSVLGLHVGFLCWFTATALDHVASQQQFHRYPVVGDLKPTRSFWRHVDSDQYMLAAHLQKGMDPF